MSKIIVIVGARGTGKTTKIKSIIKNVHPDNLIIHDISNQYGEFGYMHIDIDEFLQAADVAQNKVIVFEEATVYFGNRGYSKLATKILVRSRHTKNAIILAYHSFRTIPRYVYDLINEINVLKTNDSYKFTLNRFEDENLMKIFKEVNEHKDTHFSKLYVVQSLP